MLETHKPHILLLQETKNFLYRHPKYREYILPSVLPNNHGAAVLVRKDLGDGILLRPVENVIGVEIPSIDITAYSVYWPPTGSKKLSSLQDLWIG